MLQLPEFSTQMGGSGRQATMSKVRWAQARPSGPAVPGSTEHFCSFSFEHRVHRACHQELTVWWGS